MIGVKIPRREPELVEAEARQRYHGDTEKVPTTTIKTLTVRGVVITSRYDKAAELELMQEMILGLHSYQAEMIETLFCDSKACLVFTVELRGHHCEHAVRAIGQTIEEVALELNGGHNGIFVSAGIDDTIIIEPQWLGDDFPIGSGHE
jgi:hypothetical protein